MKKMRKAKVITVLALTVVILAAMTGLAAATPSTTTSPASVDVDISTNAPTTITVKHIIQSGDYLADAISFRLTRTQPFVSGVTDELTGSWDGSTWLGGNGQLDSATLVDDTYAWTFYVKDAKDTDDAAQIDYTYKVVFKVWNTTYGEIGAEDAELGGSSTTINPIPEFATIAMPVAAILGLVLFFNHRKHKKE